MHPVLVGTLSLGFLEIPVKVYAAKEEREAATTQLCAECLTPVRLRRWCPACEREVEADQVVRGVRRGKGFAPATASGPAPPVEGGGTAGGAGGSAAPERGISVTAFVSAAEIDPLYVEKSYFLEPGKPDAQAFKLLQRGLEVSGQAAFGRAVLRTRETPAVIRPWGRILVMHSLSGLGEVRQAARLRPARGRLRPKDLKLMLELIRLAGASSFRSALAGGYAGPGKAPVGKTLLGEAPMGVGQEEVANTGESGLAGLLSRSLAAWPRPQS